VKASEEGNNMNCDLKRKKSYSIYFDLSVDDNTLNYNCCERCVDLCTPIPRKFLFPTGALSLNRKVFTKGPSPGFSATFFQTLAAFPYCLDLQRAAEH